MDYLIGIDGGGTRTSLALAAAGGGELLRRSGPAGIVDPRAPERAAATLAALVHDAAAEAGFDGPARALCAGLAGVGNPADREVVRQALEASGVARRVVVVCDGEIALEGALGGGAGILLIGGTGSIAHGRAEDGRTGRCGGWGMMVGDEGSGFALGRDALRAALRAEDGRGGETRLLPELLGHLGLADPHAIPSWAGRAAKAEIAALAPLVLRLAAEGDGPAAEIVRTAARHQAAHAAALIERLGPWSEPPAVVLAGGLLRTPAFAALAEEAMRRQIPGGFRVRAAAEDAVAGALRMAARESRAAA